MSGETPRSSVDCRIEEEGTAILAEYARIPIAFEVMSVFDVRLVDQGLSGIVLSERKLAVPYVKDYDAIEKARPTSWGKRWDISKWGVISAFSGGDRIGGCVMAHNTGGSSTPERRRDVPELWDIRVAPAFRHAGVGSRLFGAAVAWARKRGCHRFKIETQNINVPACRFYAKQGCVLGAIDRFAYEESPDEVQLVWNKTIEQDAI